MKLRILGDTLRLRLSQADMQRLTETGRVEETTHFGPGTALVYAIERDAERESVGACFDQGTITVGVPPGMLRGWTESEEVSMRATQSVEDGHSLSLLIEKDFKCLVPREGEEDYDGFANPNVTC